MTTNSHHRLKIWRTHCSFHTTNDTHSKRIAPLASIAYIRLWTNKQTTNINEHAYHPALITKQSPANVPRERLMRSVLTESNRPGNFSIPGVQSKHRWWLRQLICSFCIVEAERRSGERRDHPPFVFAKYNVASWINLIAICVGLSPCRSEENAKRGDGVGGVTELDLPCIHIT